LQSTTLQAWMLMFDSITQKVGGIFKIHDEKVTGGLHFFRPWRIFTFCTELNTLNS
jgi:hypothetical protein